LHGNDLNTLLCANPAWAIHSTQDQTLTIITGPSISGLIAGPTSSTGTGLLANHAFNVNRPDKPPEL